MPPLPTTYVRRPYVRSGRLADLLLIQGEQIADAERRRGDIQARLWSDLGQQIGGGIQQYAQQRQDAPRLAQADELRRLQLSGAQREEATARQEQLVGDRLRDVFESGNLTPDAILGTGIGPERANRLFTGLLTLHNVQRDDYQGQRQDIARVALGVKALPEALQEEGWKTAIAPLAARGLIDAETAKIPYSPENLDMAINWALTPAEIWERAHPTLIQRDPTRDLVNPQTAEVISAGRPEVGQFQDVDARVTFPDGRIVTGKIGYNPRTNAFAPQGSTVPFPTGTQVDRLPPPRDPNIREDAQTRARQSRMDRSYEAETRRIEVLRKPLSERVERISRLIDTIDQQSPQADALIAPELLTAMAGGMGSGLRMNEAEIARIIGGRSNWEGLKAWANKWQIDPAKAVSLTTAQRGQVRTLVAAVADRVTRKLQMIDAANDVLLDAPDVEAQRRIRSQLQRQLDAIGLETGGGTGGRTTIGRFEVEIGQ